MSGSRARYRFLIIAGETSGDTLAAEFVHAVNQALPDGESAEWFGAGGPRMRDAGVELLLDLTQHAVVGLLEPIKRLGFFKRLMADLTREAELFRPDAVITVDYSGFNLRWARHWLKRINAPPYGSSDRPWMVYFISPQVWASRADRAEILATHYDLLLSIFPFEKAWYAKHAPSLPVDYIGHPIVDRYPLEKWNPKDRLSDSERPAIILLPGSRQVEIRHHWPVFVQMVRRVWDMGIAAEFSVVLPNEQAAQQLRKICPPASLEGIKLIVGDLNTHLMRADLAVACSGTVTMECAWFGVPTIVVYKTSWLTYQVAKRLITVPHLAMPNLLAGRILFPEFIQENLKPEPLAREVQSLLQNQERRQDIALALKSIRADLGQSGSCLRAAKAFLKTIHKKK